MGKKKSEDIDTDQIIKDMRDATMDKLNKMVHPEISEKDAERVAEALYFMYAAMVKVGFTKAQAMDLVKHMISISVKGII